MKSIFSMLFLGLPCAEGLAFRHSGALRVAEVSRARCVVCRVHRWRCRLCELTEKDLVISNPDCEDSILPDLLNSLGGKRMKFTHKVPSFASVDLPYTRFAFDDAVVCVAYCRTSFLI